MNTFNLYRTILALVLVIAFSANGIPWPVGASGPDSLNCYSLMNTYGEMNLPWDEAGSGIVINFHSGIDISYEDISSENVWCVENGVFTDVHSWFNPLILDYEWIAVISPNSSSDEGWCYCHVQGDDGTPNLSSVGIYDDADLGDLLGTMTERTDKHLHFARTGATAPLGYNGVDNPLDYLTPQASSAENFTWSLSSPQRSIFFLPELLAFDDPNNQAWEDKWSTASSVWTDTLDRQCLSESVDLLYSIASSAWGEIGFPQEMTMPQSIEWTLFRTMKTGEDSLFTKYVVDFDDDLGYSGSTPSDWQEYKRLYFKYTMSDLTGVGPTAFITCLTNCSDASAYDGINNIDENCWQTDIDLSGTGTATVNTRAQFPDGRYRVEITSYAHDGTPHIVSEDVVIHNFFPMLNWAHMWQLNI